MADASTLIRAARKSRELTQQELAALAQVNQGQVSRSESGREAEFSTVRRLLAGAGYRLYAAPTQRDDAVAIASEIRTKLKANERSGAFRSLLQLNDNLLAEKGLVRAVLGLAEPETTKNPVWDAAIAGIVAWRLHEEGLPVPDWTSRSNRFLKTPATLEIDPADPTPPPREVPAELLNRGVLVWRDTFRSV